MSQETLSILEPEEKIVWQDHINRKVLGFQLIASIAAFATISIFILSKNPSINPVTLFIIAIGIVSVKFFSEYVKAYYITDKRIIIKSGLIGTDFESIYFGEIRTANVNINLIGKIFSTGTINIDTGKIETVGTGTGDNRRSSTRTAYTKLSYIDNPYDIYRQFQSILSSRQ